VGGIWGHYVWEMDCGFGIVVVEFGMGMRTDFNFLSSRIYLTI
jgi:hypothetical protein